MKRNISFLIGILFLTIILFLQFSTIVFAQTVKLETVDVKASKAKIAPGEEVTITTNFGQAMGAYTINVEYDPNVFDYVKSVGGADSNQSGKVILTYHYVQGNESPRENASITFKAKESIVADTPTDFSVTITGMSNPDNSQEYDDITEAFKEDVLVQPNYVNYNLKLEYDGIILPKLEKSMKLITESAMGKNYDHVRLIANITKTPSKDATVKILATDEEEAEVDILHSGWGEAEGYSLGGKNVKQELNLRGEFSEIGDYVLNIKLINRDNEDETIVSKDFNITVGEKKAEDKTNEVEKDTLPKTGTTQYGIIILIITIFAIGYLFVSKENKE